MKSLDKRVEELASYLVTVRKMEDDIAEKSTELTCERTNIEKTEQELKQMLRKGKKLSDPLVDFAFYNFGLEYQDRLGSIKEFLELIQKYSEEQILSWKNSGIATATQVDTPPWRFPETYLLGELKSPGYKIEMPSRNFSAKTSQLFRFDEEKGFVPTDSGLDLFPYLMEFIGGFQLNFRASPLQDMCNRKLLKGLRKKLGSTSDLPLPTRGYRAGIELTDTDKNGFQMDIYVERNPPMTFGGSAKYNGNIKSSLIVGTEKVRKFLESGHLEVETKSPAQIPEF